MATKEIEKPQPKAEKTAKPVRDARDVEQVKVERWRQEQVVKLLRKYGLEDEQIDLNIVKMLVKKSDCHHALEALLLRGCDPETAIRIVG